MPAKETPQLNYPDLLGTITGGQRLNVDLVQCAVTTRPDRIAAGQNFEILVLVQNASDIDVDVTVEMRLPDRDMAKQRGMFFSKSARTLIGLQPAEVGYAILPASCSPKTQPGSEYAVSIDLRVDKVKRNDKPSRVRTAEGGGDFNFDSVPDNIQAQIAALKTLSWEIETRGKKNHLEASFTVMPRGLAMLQDFNVNWIRLWTMKDYLDEFMMADKVRGDLDVFLQQVNKETMFKPILMAVQATYEKAQFPLKIAEAIFIAKILTYVLCDMAIERPTDRNPRPEWPRWYKELLRQLVNEPRIRDHAPKVISTMLFPYLLHDGIMRAFEMVTTVTGEDFGDKNERRSYADDVLAQMQHGGPLRFSAVYLPLILAGVIVNNRVVMPKEQVRETLFALNKVKEGRAAEKTEDNAFIFDLMDSLVDRALEHF